MNYVNNFYSNAFKGAYLRLYYNRMFFYLRDKRFIHDTTYRYVHIKNY